MTISHSADLSNHRQNSFIILHFVILNEHFVILNEVKDLKYDHS